MKANIITFHFVHNCGAVLQCFALQEKLKELGCDPEVVNYRPQYHAKRYACLVSPYRCYRDIMNNLEDKSRVKSRMTAWIKAVSANRKVIGNLVRRHNFESFLKEHIQQGIRCTTQQELIKQYGEKRELFITGSDQVWNRKYTGEDNSYFLCFTSSKAVTVAYAVSMGDEKTAGMTGTAELVDGFDAISMRERTHAMELGNALGRKIANTLDPTLLLPQSAYLKCEKEVRKIKHRRYILVYSLAPSGQLSRSLNKLLEEEKDTVAVNLSRFLLKGVPKHRVMNLQSIGPGEFLTCIKEAQCILTDSFHGTAFSIIYHKKFWAFENKNGSLRLKELLCALKLNNRFMDTKSSKLADMEEGINYETADMLLSRAVAGSSNFLKEALHTGKL